MLYNTMDNQRPSHCSIESHLSLKNLMSHLNTQCRWYCLPLIVSFLMRYSLFLLQWIALCTFFQVHFNCPACKCSQITDDSWLQKVMTSPTWNRTEGLWPNMPHWYVKPEALGLISSWDSEITFHSQQQFGLIWTSSSTGSKFSNKLRITFRCLYWAGFLASFSTFSSWAFCHSAYFSLASSSAKITQDIRQNL